VEANTVRRKRRFMKRVRGKTSWGLPRIDTPNKGRGLADNVKKLGLLTNLIKGPDLKGNQKRDQGSRKMGGGDIKDLWKKNPRSSWTKCWVQGIPTEFVKWRRGERGKDWGRGVRSVQQQMG